MTPAPAVQAYCYIPRINHGEWVDFLVDTGASATCLNGIYARDLRNNMRPHTLSPSHGIGGSCEYFYEEAILVFRDDYGQYLSRPLDIGVQQIQQQHLNDPRSLYCPCLLGRDILNSCTLNYDPSHNDIALIFP